MRKIIQSAHNSVYPTIFILIHNLITYTTLRTNHLKSDKNTIIMAKSLPKRLNNQSNQRTSTHCHVKVKRPDKLQFYVAVDTGSLVELIIEAFRWIFGHGGGIFVQFEVVST